MSCTIEDGGVRLDREPPVVLIYQLGNSEPQVDDQFFPRGSEFRARVAELLALPGRPPAEDEGPVLVVEEAGRERRVTFPILAPVLAHVRNEHKTAPIALEFIVTDQEPPQRSDTVDVPRLVERWLVEGSGGRIFGDVRVETAFVIREDPSDDDRMVRAFAEEIVPALQPAIAEASAAGERRVFYCAGPGTPAMRFGAGLALGRDARVTFVTKGAEKPVAEVDAYLRVPRQRTLDLLDQALADFDPVLAHRILADRDSGFDPNAPAVRDALNRIVLIRDWQAEFFPEAAKHARAASLSKRSANSPLAWLVAQLSNEPGRNPEAAPNWAKFWRAKLLDVSLRLMIARGREDVPGFVDRLRHIRDVALLYGITRYGVTRSFRASRMTLSADALRDLADRFGWVPPILPSEDEADPDGSIETYLDEFAQMRFLIWRIRNPHRGDDHPDAARQWLRSLLLLRFLATDRHRLSLHDFRNRHIHDAALFERSLLDDYVSVYTADDETAIFHGQHGADLILGLVSALNGTAPDPLPVTPEALLREYLGIPHRLAESYRLPIPLAAAERLAHLAEPDQAAQGEFIRVLRERYEQRYPRHLLQRVLRDEPLHDPELKRKADWLTDRIGAFLPSLADREDWEAQELLNDGDRALRNPSRTRMRTRGQIVEAALGARTGEDRAAIRDDVAIWLSTQRGAAQRAAALERLLSRVSLTG